MGAAEMKISIHGKSGNRAAAACGVLICLLISGVARAEKSLVVASGDCDQSDLLSQLRTFTAELRQQAQGEVLSETEIRDRLGAPSARSVDELQRQLDAAQLQFYEALYARAGRQVAEAFIQIERLPVGPSRVRLRTQALVLMAMVHRGLGRMEEGDAAFETVLRQNPAHRLDPDNYAPSVRARFEKLRAQLAKQARAHLMVKSSPSGAEVYLDGLKVGVTPYSADQVPGRYQLVVEKQQATSLPHPLELRADLSIQVDLAFEGALEPRRLPCIAASEDEKARLGQAVKLGTLLGVPEVVMLRVDRPPSGTSWVAATLVRVDTGQKVREGGLKISERGLPPDGLKELVGFILTGQSGTQVMVSPSQAPSPVPSTPSATAGHSTAQAVSVASALPPGTTLGWKSKAAIGLAVTAAVAAGTGVAFQLNSAASWQERNGYFSATGLDRADAPRVKQIEDRAAQQQGLAVGCFVAAGVSALAGGALYLWEGARTRSPAPLSVALNPSGAQVAAAFTWP